MEANRAWGEGGASARTSEENAEAFCTNFSTKFSSFCPFRNMCMDAIPLELMTWSIPWFHMDAILRKQNQHELWTSFLEVPDFVAEPGLNHNGGTIRNSISSPGNIKMEHKLFHLFSLCMRPFSHGFIASFALGMNQRSRKLHTGVMLD